MPHAGYLLTFQDSFSNRSALWEDALVFGLALPGFPAPDHSCPILCGEEASPSWHPGQVAGSTLLLDPSHLSTPVDHLAGVAALLRYCFVLRWG